MAKVIHADIDPAEIGKNREADVPIVGDCQEVIAALIEELTGPDSEGIGDYADWVAEMTQVRQTYPLGYTEPDSGAMSPQYVIERIGAIAGPEATYVAGVGQHQMWAAQFVRYSRPNSWLNSGGLGTMGYCVPAAMGAQIAEPDRVVWALSLIHI